MIYIVQALLVEIIPGIEMTGKKYLFDSRSHLSEEALAMYVDALEAGEVYSLPGGILEHVEECKECKLDIVEVAWLAGPAAVTPVSPQLRIVKKGAAVGFRFSIIYRIAAVVLIGAGVGILANHFVSTKSENALPTDLGAVERAHAPEVPKNSPERNGGFEEHKNLADSFSPSPNLDNLVNASLRSESPLVLSPANNTIVGREILFKWRIVPPGSTRLTIVSNSERVLRIITLQRSAYRLSHNFPPGLYYWKLERGGELQHVGKFFVR